MRNRYLATAAESVLRMARVTFTALQSLTPSGRRRLVLELRIAVGAALAESALETPADFGAAAPPVPRIAWDLWHYVNHLSNPR
ncbi:hypothetical protein [Nocardia sp. NPDC050710]|uniref:hypothetical protein n=1 Tax=Nocardia sp. NPDC050710 TaxID=3157220 RepID=UPI0033E2F3B0